MLILMNEVYKMIYKYFNRPFILGILFTLIIAVISIVLAELPIISSVGALAVALVIGVFYRQTLGYPELLFQPKNCCVLLSSYMVLN